VNVAQVGPDLQQSVSVHAEAGHRVEDVLRTVKALFTTPQEFGTDHHFEHLPMPTLSLQHSNSRQSCMLHKVLVGVSVGS